MGKKHTIALAGNPNSGKTTLFNALTGANQRVGNWPGVTVERVEGAYSHGGADYNVVDLPGIYSFSAYSLDEKVSREFILNEKPDLVVNIVDATNLERNLYLTTQLLEMKVPLVVALNMMDVARRQKIKIEVEHLAKHLDCPVIPIVANKGEGLDKLLSAIDEAADGRKPSKAKVEYDLPVEEAISAISAAAADVADKAGVDARWLAVKLLEGDELAIEITKNAFDDLVQKESAKIQRHTGDDADIAVADGRYGFIHGLAKDVIDRSAQMAHSATDAIDKIVLNRIVGIPIFLTVMFMMFSLTMNIGAPFIDFFDKLCGAIFVDGLGHLLESWGTPPFLTAFLSDGVGGGIRTVATFIPPIGLIFLFLSILEDSGYMARASFVMDRFLRAIGLPGKAFIPMLVGLGCNVPGILATRTLESDRDRILSILINPLISCGARLPVYALFAAAFFKHDAALMLFGIYFTGIALAVLMGLLFGKTILQGEASTFVMELPPYHVPTVNGVLSHTWHRLKCFLIRAGKVIVLVVAVLGVLNAVSTDGSLSGNNPEKSILSQVGKKATPIFHPMGITDNNWPAVVGLFAGIFAKEAVVGTISSIYSMETGENGAEPPSLKKEVAEAFMAIPKGFQGFWGSIFDPLGFHKIVAADNTETDARPQGNVIRELRSRFPDKAAVIAYLLFVLIYIPCVSVIAAIYRETNWKWAVFSVGYLTGLAWVVATMFYQASRLLEDPAGALPWLAACGIALAAFPIALKRAGIIRRRIKDRAP